MRTSDEAIVQALMKAGLLNAAHFRRLQEEQHQWGGKLHHLAVDLGILREDQIAATVSRELKIPWLRLAELPYDHAAMRLVGAQECERLVLFPCALSDEGRTLWLAMSDPFDSDAVERVRARAQVARIKTGIAGKSEILAFVHRHYQALGRDAGRRDVSLAPSHAMAGLALVDASGRSVAARDDSRKATPPPQAIATDAVHPGRASPLLVGVSGHLPVGPSAGPPSIHPQVPQGAHGSFPLPMPSASPPSRPSFARILLDHGVVDGALLGQASAIAISGDVPVVYALIRWRLVDAAVVAATLSRALNCPVSRIDSLAQAPAVPVTRASCVRGRLLPLWRLGSVVGVAMSDPTDDHAAQSLANAFGVTIERLLVDDDDLERALAALAERDERAAQKPSPSPALLPAAPATSIPSTLPEFASANPPGAAAGHRPDVPAVEVQTAYSDLSVVKGVLTDRSSGQPVARDNDDQGAATAVLNLEGATLEPVVVDEETASEDLLRVVRLLVVGKPTLIEKVRVGLQGRVRSLVGASKLSEAVALASTESLDLIVVLEPPEAVLRSSQFAALTQRVRRALLVVGGASGAPRVPNVRYFARKSGHNIVEVVVRALQATLTQ
jgi:hypothetical protein